MGTITFNNHKVKFDLKDKLLLKSLIGRVFAEEKVAFKSVTYVFCTDDYLLKLNQEYLNHNTLTDILTFTLSDPFLPIISEIYISIDRVAENASNLQETFNSELFRVMIHGVLHLCGYGDHTEKEKNIMRQKEDHYLSFI